MSIQEEEAYRLLKEHMPKLLAEMPDVYHFLVTYFVTPRKLGDLFFYHRVHRSSGPNEVIDA